MTIANLLTYVRLAAIPVLLVLAAMHLRSAYLWLLATAWATDLIDGPIARLQGQDSARGAKLDSIADRGIMVSIPIGVAWLWPEVLMREALWVALLGIALVVPHVHAFAKFRQLPAYHTWLAKGLAVYMGLSLLLLLNGHWPWLFRAGALIALVEALEEIAITHTLKRPRADVASWWHLRRSS